VLGGAALLDSSTAVLDGPAVRFDSNTAANSAGAGFGGALFLANGATIEVRGRAAVAGNMAQNGGGGVYAYFGSGLSVARGAAVEFNGNSGGGNGGGLDLERGARFVVNGSAAFYGKGAHSYSPTHVRQHLERILSSCADTSAAHCRTRMNTYMCPHAAACIRRCDRKCAGGFPQQDQEMTRRAPL
jgi:hypothetical protein